MDEKTVKAKPSRMVIFGAAFLMATSAIGPGFLTQTATFTATYGSQLITVLILVIAMDIIAQMNIWSVVCVSGLRGQDVANKVLPGLGYVLAALVSLGGLAFNIGNVGGTALGLNAMFGINERAGAILAGVLGILIFISKNATAIMDKVSTILAAIILITVAIVADLSPPPGGQGFNHIKPTKVPLMFIAMTTMLGGSCGGYQPFAGSHRLLEAGVTGPDNVGHVRRSVVQGCGTSGVVRILMFLAVLGTCTIGTAWNSANADAIISASNPAAEAFRLAAGSLGYRLFGLCLFSAGISSVIGAAYTSVSFLKTLHPFIGKHNNAFVILLIAVSTAIMAILGGAADLLIIAGALNGLILPITLCVMMIACRKKSIVGEKYHHPTILIILGVAVMLLAAFTGIRSLPNLMKLFH